mgnify:FL=1
MEYTTQRMVTYPHLNAAGILVGGTALSWIDQDAMVYAANLLETSRIATAKVSEVVFNSAANIGDILITGVELVRVGKTSITLKCELRNKTTNKVIVQVEEVVLVTIDFNKKPTPHKLYKERNPE